jgi:hypothetical protein
MNGANDLGSDSAVPALATSSSPDIKIRPFCHNRPAVEFDKSPWCEKKFPSPAIPAQSARHSNTSVPQPLFKQETPPHDDE